MTPQERHTDRMDLFMWTFLWSGLAAAVLDHQVLCGSCLSVSGTMLLLRNTTDGVK